MIEGNFVVDMQHHYIPAESLQFVGKTSEYDYATTLKRYPGAYSIITNIDANLAYMEAAGIDVAILSTAAFAPNGFDFCRACNSGYASVVKRYPDRLKGLIHIYPQDNAQRNRDEIKRCVEELGLFGIALLSSYGATTLDSAAMDPIYASALRYDMPIFVHPTIRTSLWGGDRYDMYTTVSREYDVAKSFVEILYGVLPRFPDLKVIMAHLGGGLPTLKGRLLAWHQPENIPIPPESRRHGLSIDETKELGLYQDFESRLKNVLFDSAGYGGWTPVIRSALETLGADHTCFGSDYPYELEKSAYARRALLQINQLDAPADDKKKYFGGNLKTAFRL